MGGRIPETGRQVRPCEEINLNVRSNDNKGSCRLLIRKKSISSRAANVRIPRQKDPGCVGSHRNTRGVSAGVADLGKVSY